MSRTRAAYFGLGAARNGKVARAPYAVRTRVNEMLRDGATARQVIEYLEAQGIKDVSDCSITIWRHGGYLDWLAERERLAEEERLGMMARRRDLALEIVKQCQGSQISEATFHIAASQIYEVLADFNPARLKALLEEKPERYGAIVNALARLAAGAAEQQRLREAKSAAAQGLADKAGGGLTPETLAQIEEATKLL
ncbi:MAG: DUF3486 family protein [Verrucomicrobia bacterium]|nr:DUF3486 family protein [Verrucomicrobiota bacterium]MDE3098198.1 DUF3486 family protein [Verrucomicrobiota bacterium]